MTWYFTEPLSAFLIMSLAVLPSLCSVYSDWKRRRSVSGRRRTRPGKSSSSRSTSGGSSWSWWRTWTPSLNLDQQGGPNRGGAVPSQSIVTWWTHPKPRSELPQVTMETTLTQRSRDHPICPVCVLPLCFVPLQLITFLKISQTSYSDSSKRVKFNCFIWFIRALKLMN